MFTLFFFFFSSFSLIPIPKRLSGIHFGADPALINIEVFCDSVCPDCATTWPVVESVLNQYPNQVGVQLHFLALPSHTWAYAVARGVFAVNSISADAARQLVHGLYAKREQNQFTASALKNTPESKVIQSILNYISSTYGLDAIKVQQAYNSTATVQNTRIDFKYAFLRHVPGTPTVYINGAQTKLNEESKLSDWVSAIKPLL
jgi:predicted DsbA family dithiol-disulfide isomerase